MLFTAFCITIVCILLYVDDEKNFIKASNMDHIKIVDSIENFKLIEILTSDHIKESIIYHHTKPKSMDKDKEKHEKVTDHKEESITNLLLVGIDSRRNDFKHARADTIMIASMNKTNKEIKLISILRDTYVKIPRHKNNRINATYAFGGVSLLKETIHNNFDLNLDKHIVIDFKGFQKVIDMLGGVDVDIKKYEVNELNKCIVSIGGSRKHFIKKAGLNHLNGHQALAYCRIRKVGRGDYERTQRQRKIIKLMIEKIRALALKDYPKLIRNIDPYVKTNISYKECLKLIYDHYNIKDWHIESMQIPTKSSGKSKMIHSMWVIEPDIDECIKYMKAFIY